MDVTSSRLIVGFYFGLGALLAGVIYFALEQFDTNSTTQATSIADLPVASGTMSAKRPFPASPPPLPAGASAELDTIRQLREMLDKRTALYREQNERLQLANAEYARVQEEADKYLGLLAEFLVREIQQEEQAARNSPSSAAHSPATSEVEAEVSADSPAAPGLPLTALDQALARVTELETALEAETETTSETLKVLLKIGAPAVPALIELLTDESASQRRWAATILGQMGAQAKDAESALIMALDDPDPEVRHAAEEAIKLID